MEIYQTTFELCFPVRQLPDAEIFIEVAPRLAAGNICNLRNQISLETALIWRSLLIKTEIFSPGDPRINIEPLFLGIYFRLARQIHCTYVVRVFLSDISLYAQNI